MTLVPLGDCGWLARFANEAAAQSFAEAVRLADPDWLEDAVPAYATVGIFYDGSRTTSATVERWLRSFDVRSSRRAETPRTVTIPVCYERGLDGPIAATQLGRPLDDIIARHTAATFTIYAIGFVPGFPYMGYLPAELAGLSRLASPRTAVPAGSVGLTGRQTGIYPLERPGGWPIIGRTPLTIVDVADRFFPLAVGDRVRFSRIDDAEYARLDGERLR